MYFHCKCKRANDTVLSFDLFYITRVLKTKGSLAFQTSDHFMLHYLECLPALTIPEKTFKSTDVSKLAAKLKGRFCFFKAALNELLAEHFIVKIIPSIHP